MEFVELKVYGRYNGILKGTLAIIHVLCMKTIELDKLLVTPLPLQKSRNDLRLSIKPIGIPKENRAIVPDRLQPTAPYLARCQFSSPVIGELHVPAGAPHS